MKKLNIIVISIFQIGLLASCKVGDLDLQKDSKYVAGGELQPEINKSALKYLTDRGKTPLLVNDTLFKYMQLGLEYAGMDLSEYEKPNRTFLLLSNNSIRVLPTTTTTVNGKPVVTTTSSVPTAGFWFDFPILDKNPDGSYKFNTDGTPVTHPAKSWSEYSPQTVKNYFLYLIGQGDLGFNNVTNANASIQSILPVGSVATKESRLGYYVPGLVPNYNLSNGRIITTSYPNGGAGFDPESRFNMKITNGEFTPLVVNDNTNVTTGGLKATNGQIHVVSTTLYPFRY